MPTEGTTDRSDSGLVDEARSRRQPGQAGSLQRKAEQLAETNFLGGPIDDFTLVGRHCLDVLLREGLNPDSRVLDVGCGALRVGYWLMRLLDSGCYYGIEPERDMLAVGLQQLVELEVAVRAEAHFSHNDDFDLSVFNESFEFVLARSIWTHASKRQISAMLSSFGAIATPGTVLLATYHPASSLLARLPRRATPLWTKLPLDAMSPLLTKVPLHRSREYWGDSWVGRSHQSDQPGVVHHSLRWIADEARQHGFKTELLPYPIINHQYWLRITRRA